MKKYQAKVTHVLVSDGVHTSVLQAEAAARYVSDAIEQNPVQEQHWVITMDTHGFPIARHFIALGSLDGAMVNLRDIFRAAILDNAYCFTYLHNHPLVDFVVPSESDRQSAQIIVSAGCVMRLPLYDSIIVTSQTLKKEVAAYSFRKAGWPGIVDLDGKQYRTGPEAEDRPTLPGYARPAARQLQAVAASLSDRPLLTADQPTRIGPP